MESKFNTGRKNMPEKNLYQTLLEEFKYDLEFKNEYQILDITEKICILMKEKNISKVELSRRLGTSKAAVTKMLDGSANFSVKRLIKIADALEKEISICFVDPEKHSGKIDFNQTIWSEVESADMETNETGGLEKESKHNLFSA